MVLLYFEEKSFNNLKNCLKNLKGELTSSKDANEYDTSLDKVNNKYLKRLVFIMYE